jgi:hypothetical protein
MAAGPATATTSRRLMESPPLSAPDNGTPLAELSFQTRDQEGVALLAYSYWEERMRNNIPGSAENDWYQAEQDLRL